MKVEEVCKAVPFSLEDPTKVIKFGNQLSLDKKEKLVTFLRNNANVFAWSHKDMPRIDLGFICHCLFVHLISR